MCDGTKQMYWQTKYTRKYQLKLFLLSINNSRGNYYNHMPNFTTVHSDDPEYSGHYVVVFIFVIPAVLPQKRVSVSRG